jgi:oxygen-independent coproporphyrinogen-3 oxidase
VITPLKKREGYAGLYIHFPHCIVKCDYCDFYSIGSGKKENSPDEEKIFTLYVKEIEERIRANPEILNLKFDTVFFGGGTPSRISPKTISNFLQYLRNTLNITEDVEMSLEANPEDVTGEILSGLHESGINRVNVGVQSFSEENLKKLGRYYDKEKYQSLLETLNHSLIKRYGVDLIYGIPGQKVEEVYSDIELVLNSTINHFSLYALTVEKGTEYSRNIKDKKSFPPNEEVQEKILLTLPDYLASHGFLQYEVSNFSKPGFESRHNLKYWTMQYYLGLGPGAHGYLPKGRYSNQRSLDLYMLEKFSDHYEKPNPGIELSLTLFRLFLPFDLASFLKEFSEKEKSIIINEVERFQRENKAIYENGIFKWKPEAVLNLDREIFNIAEKL